LEGKKSICRSQTADADFKERIAELEKK